MKSAAEDGGGSINCKILFYIAQRAVPGAHCKEILRLMIFEMALKIAAEQSAPNEVRRCEQMRGYILAL
jgi:hypothetical protein